MSAEFTEAQRRYLLKKVKADIQNGSAKSIEKLTMLYEIESKLTIKKAR